MTILYILSGILLLGILIAVHEFGHFFFARITGIEVREFALGFGPKIFSRVGKKGTRFSLRAIPLGGYCAFYGDETDKGAGAEKDPRDFNSQPVWKRFLSILMGPGMNFILAFLVVVIMYWSLGTETLDGYQHLVSDVMAAGPAYSAGLQGGDVIRTVNGISLETTVKDSLGELLQRYDPEGDPVTIGFERNGESQELELRPVWSDENGKWMIGIMEMLKAKTHRNPVTLGEAISSGWDYSCYAGRVILTALGQMVTTGEGIEETTGPVGVVSTVSGYVREYGAEGFFELLAVISINLGLMNLLPIPGLDGSRLIFLLIELIRGKPMPKKVEAGICLVGLALLMGLMLVLTVKDVAGLFHG